MMIRTGLGDDQRGSVMVRKGMSDDQDRDQ